MMCRVRVLIDRLHVTTGHKPGVTTGKRQGPTPLIRSSELRSPATAEALHQCADGAEVAAGDYVAMAPSACRAQGTTPENCLYVRREIGDKKYLALIDTGSTLSLLGDIVYKDCPITETLARGNLEPKRKAQYAFTLVSTVDGGGNVSFTWLVCQFLLF